MKTKITLMLFAFSVVLSASKCKSHRHDLVIPCDTAKDYVDAFFQKIGNDNGQYTIAGNDPVAWKISKDDLKKLADDKDSAIAILSHEKGNLTLIIASSTDGRISMDTGIICETFKPVKRMYELNTIEQRDVFRDALFQKCP